MILVDISQLSIATVMVELRLTGERAPAIKSTRERILRSVGYYRTNFKSQFGEMVICADSKNYWRRQIFPFYKAGRKKTRASSKFDWNLILFQINQVIDEISEHIPIKVLRVDGAEADDLIGSIGQRDEYRQSPLLVISGDKDFGQLLQWDNVFIYHPTQKRFLTKADPKRSLYELILRGDRDDGIPNFLSDSDTLVTEGKRQKPLFEEQLQGWLEQKPEQFCDEKQLANFHRNETLIDFTKIPQEVQDRCIQALESASTSRDTNLSKYFMNNGLIKLLADAQQFV